MTRPNRELRRARTRRIGEDILREIPTAEVEAEVDVEEDTTTGDTDDRLREITRGEEPEGTEPTRLDGQQGELRIVVDGGEAEGVEEVGLGIRHRRMGNQNVWLDRQMMERFDRMTPNDIYSMLRRTLIGGNGRVAGDWMDEETRHRLGIPVPGDRIGRDGEVVIVDKEVGIMILPPNVSVLGDEDAGGWGEKAGDIRLGWRGVLAELKGRGEGERRVRKIFEEMIEPIKMFSKKQDKFYEENNYYLEVEDGVMNQIFFLRVAYGQVLYLDRGNRFLEIGPHIASQGIGRGSIFSNGEVVPLVRVMGWSAIGGSVKRGKMGVASARYWYMRRGKTADVWTIIMPDAVWDMMVPLFEEGIFLWPEMLLSAGLGEGYGYFCGGHGGYDKYPATNRVGNGWCTGQVRDGSLEGEVNSRGLTNKMQGAIVRIMQERPVAIEGNTTGTMMVRVSYGWSKKVIWTMLEVLKTKGFRKLTVDVKMGVMCSAIVDRGVMVKNKKGYTEIVQPIVFPVKRSSGMVKDLWLWKILGVSSYPYWVNGMIHPKQMRGMRRRKMEEGNLERYRPSILEVERMLVRSGLEETTVDGEVLMDWAKPTLGNIKKTKYGWLKVYKDKKNPVDKYRVWEMCYKDDMGLSTNGFLVPLRGCTDGERNGSIVLGVTPRKKEDIPPKMVGEVYGGGEEGLLLDKSTLPTYDRSGNRTRCTEAYYGEEW